MSKEKKDILAKIIRAAAIPPTFVTLLLTLVYLFTDDVFRHAGDLAVGIISLAVVPTLAYVLAPVLPYFKDKGRQGSRSLAFYTSAVGYIGGTIYAFATNATQDLKFIFCGYLIALVFLLVLNKLFGLHASGHACGILGPLLYTVYFLGALWLIPCILAAIAVVWSSIYRKSHSPKELALGALCALAGFCIGLI